jgi:hypothetical protein
MGRLSPDPLWRPHFDAFEKCRALRVGTVWPAVLVYTISDIHLRFTG